MRGVVCLVDEAIMRVEWGPGDTRRRHRLALRGSLSTVCPSLDICFRCCGASSREQERFGLPRTKAQIQQGRRGSKRHGTETHAYRINFRKLLRRT